MKTPYANTQSKVLEDVLEVFAQASNCRKIEGKIF